MSYLTYEYYASLYGKIPETDFNRLLWEAKRVVDNHTTGVDGVKKLKVAFPTDEDDAENVIRCTSKVLNILHQLETAEKNMSAARGYEQTENGLRGKVISSESSGTESISYSAGSASNGNTVIDKAAADQTERNKLLFDTVRQYLSGVRDANGVNLLYMGVYPCVR